MHTRMTMDQYKAMKLKQAQKRIGMPEAKKGNTLDVVGRGRRSRRLWEGAAKAAQYFLNRSK